MPQASPATAASERDNARTRGRKRRPSADGSVSVELMHARSRHAGWAVFEILLGLLMLLYLGTVFQWIGILLIGFGLNNIRRVVATFVYDPGRIELTDENVVLPRGLCRGKPVVLPVSALRHAFLLRRAVPWTKAGPLLVVETELHSFTYPRDWFANEVDQARVAATMNRRLGRE